ncbi:Serine-protein kinase RsbW [hydrothermal vent metagenome]|uniref:Serine-protein kinase RsbW n=1 Tax=hydrothermal vent metagenome TaxID=652676 RepID=A0A3B0WUL1_9ZZZZ
MLRIERIHLLSRADMLKPLRKFMRQLAKKQGCSEENIECLVMAINEACMNVIQHAYNNKNNEEIIVEFYKQKNELIIKVIDFANCVDISQIKSRDLKEIRPGGLGVHIINEVMDSVEYKHGLNEKGNVLEMRKQLNKCVSDS